MIILAPTVIYITNSFLFALGSKCVTYTDSFLPVYVPKLAYFRNIL